MPLDLRSQIFHAGRRQDFHLRLRRHVFDFYLLVVELAFAQPLAEFLPCRIVAVLLIRLKTDFPRRRQQGIEDAFLRHVRCAVPHLARFLLAGLFDGGFHQVAHDGIHVLANVADFREFRRLDLDERGLGETRKPPRNLRLAHAGGPDHENVLRRDFLAQRFRYLLAPPAIAQGDGNRFLGVVLPDDMFVEFVDDFLRGH